jgi:basic amino acid/polyamine antiporter, APA family
MFSGEILNTPKSDISISRDGVIPFRRLATIHHKFKTPYLAILLYVGLVSPLQLWGDLKPWRLIAASSLLLVYFVVSLSVIGLRRKKDLDNGGFKIPFGYTVPILSAGIILFFLSNLTGP